MTPTDSASSPRIWVVIPAAGIGARMGATTPKQYLHLHDKTILDHTLERLLQIPDLAGLFLALNANDIWWPNSDFKGNVLITCVEGGQERSVSVLNALTTLAARADDQDWVLVHDAARPCIQIASILKLYKQLMHHSVGGILALPVTDTIKKVNGDKGIVSTLDRNELWQAQTPQMFRFGLLRRCLKEAIEKALPVTDEASAVEAFGYIPLVVEGRSDNLKITRPEDLFLAKIIMQQQEIST